MKKMKDKMIKICMESMRHESVFSVSSSDLLKTSRGSFVSVSIKTTHVIKLSYSLFFFSSPSTLLKNFTIPVFHFQTTK